jgi:LPS export ABC transporter protein LptC
MIKNIFKILLLTLLILSLQSCKNDEGEINRITKLTNQPTETVKGLEVLYSDSGYVKVKVTAPVMYRYFDQNPHTVMPKGVTMFFYDAKQNVISTLTSKYAVRDELKKTMEARNDVVVKNQKGEQLNTEKLVWSEVTGKFSSDAFVKIITASQVIMGEGFEANNDFTRYSIKHPKGSITVNQKDSI